MKSQSSLNTESLPYLKDYPEGRNKMERSYVNISGVWLRTIGHRVQVLVETHGKWRLVVENELRGPFSYIVEPDSILEAPVDEIVHG